jgi:hypothetical protein
MIKEKTWRDGCGLIKKEKSRKEKAWRIFPAHT